MPGELTPAAEAKELKRAEYLAIIEEACDELEMTARERDMLLKRIGKRMKKVDLTDLSNERFEDMLGEKAMMALDYIDPFTLARSGARDLAAIVGTLLEKRQMLRGQPTQIVSHERREDLNKVGPALMRELQRRGMTVNLGPADYKEITPPPVIKRGEDG